MSSKLLLLFLSAICLSLVTGAESTDTSTPQNPTKKKGKSSKKNKKQKKVNVKVMDLDFDVPEVINAKPTAMVELSGGEFDFGSQFHTADDKITSPKVSKQNTLNSCILLRNIITHPVSSYFLPR